MTASRPQIRKRPNEISIERWPNEPRRRPTFRLRAVCGPKWRNRETRREAVYTHVGVGGQIGGQQLKLLFKVRTSVWARVSDGEAFRGANTKYH